MANHKGKADSTAEMDAERSSMHQVWNGLALFAEVVVLLVRIWVVSLYEFVRGFLPRDQIDVAGSVVLVTGTGHGIGKEIAVKYASLGAKVVAVDINMKNNEETVKLISRKGQKAHAYQCNVANRAEVFALADKVLKEVGGVDIVINNAGIMPTHPMLEHTEEEIRRIFDINVMAHFWILQAFLPQMLKRNSGHVVAISSMAGIVGLTNLVPYCGSKFAVRGLMEALSEEIRETVADTKVKFTVIFPYMVDTGLCKRPRFRFKNAFKLINPQEAAEHIVGAQRAGLNYCAIPEYLLTLNNFVRLLPPRVAIMLKDFFDSGVESDL